MKIVDVVAAVIFDNEGKILIAKRKKGKTLENYWEFPGGKVENNESETDCLKREMYEEFGVEINISKYLTTSKHNYENFTINLKAYLAEYRNGNFQLREHSEIRWIKISDYSNYMFAPADIPINKYLIQNGY